METNNGDNYDSQQYIYYTQTLSNPLPSLPIPIPIPTQTPTLIDANYYNHNIDYNATNLFDQYLPNYNDYSYYDYDNNSQIYQDYQNYPQLAQDNNTNPNLICSTYYSVIDPTLIQSQETLRAEEYPQQIYSKKIPGINLEKVFRVDEIIKLLNHNLSPEQCFKTHKIEEILATLEGKSDNIKYEVIIKYFTKSAISIFYRIKKMIPENFPTTVDILKLPKFIQNKNILLQLFNYFDFVVKNCSINEKILLLNHINDDDKINFIVKFNYLNDIGTKDNLNLHLLSRILISFNTNTQLTGQVLKKYLDNKLCEFLILEKIIAHFVEDKTFDIFQNQECKKVLSKAITYFNEDILLKIYISSFEKHLRNKVFQIIHYWISIDPNPNPTSLSYGSISYNSDAYTSISSNPPPRTTSNNISVVDKDATKQKIQLSTILDILQQIYPNEAREFLQFCSKLYVVNNPKYYNKDTYKKSYVNKYSKTLNRKNNNLLIYEEEIEIVNYINKIINSSSDIKSLSSINYNNYVFKETEINELIFSVIELFRCVKYKTEEIFTFNVFSLVEDMTDNHKSNFILIADMILTRFQIKLESASKIYSSLKKYLVTKCSYECVNVGVEKTLKLFFNNLIINNCRTIYCKNMQKIFELTSCNHYGILLEVINERINDGTIAIITTRMEPILFYIQSITDKICNELKKNKTTLTSESYDKIAYYLYTLFWINLIQSKSSYLKQFQTNILELVDSNISKVHYAVIFLNSQQVYSNPRQKNKLMQLISANVQYLDIDSIDIEYIRNIVNRDNIETLFEKMNCANKKLKILEYLIQKEMTVKDCTNYIFSMLKYFLKEFESKLNFIIMISQYINVTKKINIIKANQELFGSEYQAVITYLNKVKN